MALPRFQYHEPTALVEACAMLQAFGEESALLAGGTDLLVKMKDRLLKPQHIISLAELGEIQQIKTTSSPISIGACCTVSRLAESEAIRTTFPALASAAEQIGSPAVRNLGTLGGNIMTASPAADLPPALMAYGARVRLKTADQERILPLEEFFRGPGATCIEKGEILVDIQLKKPGEGSGAEFFKLGTRQALQISVINGSCFLSLDSRSGNIETARVVLGAVAPTHVRAISAENMLLGQSPSEDLFQEAGKAAALDCSPIDDLRGSAEYRRDMIRMRTSRSLETALQEARKPVART